MTSTPKNIFKDWSKHKLCPIHGRRYLLIEDFDHPSQTGMCAHLECVEKVISALQNNGQCGGLIKFCRKLDKDRGEDEFAVYVLMTLLSDAKKGRPTVLNPYHMRWASLNYLKKLKVQEDKVAKHKEIIEQIDEILKNETEELIDNIALSMFTVGRKVATTHEYISPEKAYAEKEITEKTIKDWGSDVYLWLIGELTDLSFCKINGCTPKDLPGIKNDYRKWYKFHTS